MKIAIASDHRGVELRQKVVALLKALNHTCEDMGPEGGQSVHYPEYAALVAQAVSKGLADKGILICGSGQGMAIAANKVSKIRASLCNDLFSARYARLHNNANVLCLGAAVLGDELALDIVKTWLTTSFEEGRHQVRVELIAEIEENLR